MKNKGQGLVEYALILVLVAVVVIVCLSFLGPLVRSIFDPQPPVPVQELNPNDYWEEVVVPPAYDGKCYKYTVNGYRSIGVSIWCVPNEDL